MTTVETISDLRKFIKSTRRQRDGLAERYGHGVRPSHVSSDLAILGQRIERYEAKIKALEASNVRLA
jgi:hypothetical protein